MTLQGRITAASNHLIYLVYVLYHILQYVSRGFEVFEKMVYFVGCEGKWVVEDADPYKVDVVFSGWMRKTVRVVHESTAKDT